jgi:hypothetical protein
MVHTETSHGERCAGAIVEAALKSTRRSRASQHHLGQATNRQDMSSPTEVSEMSVRGRPDWHNFSLNIS